MINFPYGVLIRGKEYEEQGCGGLGVDSGKEFASHVQNSSTPSTAGAALNKKNNMLA